MQNSFWKSYFSDPDPPNYLVLNVFANFGTESRFSFVLLILQTTWFTAYLHDLGTKSRFSFGILILQKKGWDECLQKPLIHDAKLILEILLFGSWSSKLPGLECFCMILGLNSTFSFGKLILQATWFTAYLHDFGTKSRFSFGILILQTSWFTAYLHDLGTKSRFNLRILILQKKGWDECLQKRLIHAAKLILEILLFGSWSFKVPGFDCFCMILGLNPRSVLGSLSSKPAGLQRICMIFGLNPDWVLSPYPPNQLVYSVFAWFYSIFAWFWDKIQIQVWDPYPPNQLFYSVFAWFWD